MPVISLSPSFWKPLAGGSPRSRSRSSRTRRGPGRAAGSAGAGPSSPSGRRRGRRSRRRCAALWSPSPRSSTKTTWFLSQNATLSKAVCVDVAAVEEREHARVGRRVRLRQLEERAEAAERRCRPRVAALVSPVSSKKNSLEVAARTELPVLGPLERRRNLRLGEPVGVERRRPVRVRVVDRDPVRLELVAVGVQILLDVGDRMSASACPAWKTIGWQGWTSSLQTCSAWSLPPFVRSHLFFGHETDRRSCSAAWHGC